MRSRAVPTRPRFGTKSQDGGKDHGCGGWLAGKDLLDSNPPASTPHSLSRWNKVARRREAREAMCGPQGKHSAGTPERSNPIRELVKRKSSSDDGRRIRKRVRQLTRASEERQVRKHQPDWPGFGNRLRTGEGFRMRRLAGGERSTRFEPASQHSQLPLLRTGVFLLNRLLMLVYAKRFLKPIRRLFLKRQKS